MNGQTVPISTSVFLAGQQAITAGWAESTPGRRSWTRPPGSSPTPAGSCWTRRRSWRRAAGSWTRPGRSSRTPRRSWRRAGRSWRTPGSSWRTPSRSSRTASGSTPTARRTWRSGWREYYDGLQELADARATLAQETADAQAELADARAELNDGEAEYAEGLAEYEDGKAEAEEEIAEAQKELEQARRDIESIEACEWYLLDRNTNTGYVSYSMDADRMGNLASVFPLIFFLVAALVCLTTMTRMVEEQRITIGGLKALGYSKGAIAVKYVGYGFLSSTVGALLGLAVGLTLLPWIICNAWNIIYTLGPVQYGLEPVTSALACLAAIGTVTLSALGACFSTLAAVPAQLMRPKAPPAGKRVLLERSPGSGGGSPSTTRSPSGTCSATSGGSG